MQHHIIVLSVKYEVIFNPSFLAVYVVSEGNKDGNVTMYNAPVEEFDVVKGTWT